MIRLLLVRHAATLSTRRAAFPVEDEPLDRGGLRAAAALRPVLAAATRCLSSPAPRAQQTAAAAGISPETDPDLAECDFGSWAGRTLDEVAALHPEGLRRWLEDPHAAPHGGESLAQMAKRVEGFLARVASLQGTTAAITHGGVVKAAVVAAIGAPLCAFWRIDISPASVTELRGDDGRWAVARTNWTVA
jgi:broad specificity phosphatase PhoE